MKQRMRDGYPVEVANVVCDAASLLSQIENLTDDYYVHKLIAEVRDELALIQARENKWVDATGYFTPESYANEHP
jgi:hypothetical protein